MTPTYLPDLARCELLVESLDHTASGVPHYLIVDRCERSSFIHLQSGNRRLIDSEEILGNWIFRLPGRSSIWLSLKTPPVRGWVVQQILKVGASEIIPERTLIFCDSDVAFLRSFDRQALLIGEKVGLLDIDFTTENVRRWTATARRLLGIHLHSGEYRNYVGNMICWNRETIHAMRQRIEENTELNWKVAVARSLNFSEYMVYGTYVREMLAYNNVDHAPSDIPLVKPSWNEKLATQSAMESFFSNLDHRTVAVMIHSKDGIAPAQYRPYLERLWKAPGHPGN